MAFLRIWGQANGAAKFHRLWVIVSPFHLVTISGLSNHKLDLSVGHVNLITHYIQLMVHVGNYTIHGSYGNRIIYCVNQPPNKPCP